MMANAQKVMRERQKLDGIDGYKALAAALNDNAELIEIGEMEVEDCARLAGYEALTDELIAESLRARKHAFDEAEFDEIDIEEGAPDQDTAKDNDGEIEFPALQPETQKDV